METVRLILLFLHFLGLSMLLGGIAVQLRAASRRVDTLMVHGVLTQLGTGILLVGVREMDDLPVNSAKYAVKLGIAAVIAVPVLVGRRRALLPLSWYAAIALLSVANVAVAVFWT
jgi:hypothetical protein